MARKTTKRKPKGRKRIIEFEWVTPSGYTQSLRETDFYSRKDFLAERRSFKKHGMAVKDIYSKRGK